MYENQEGCFRGYAERESYWVISKSISLKSFVTGAVSTPEQSNSFSGVRISSAESAETINLVTPDFIQVNPATAAC